MNANKNMGVGPYGKHVVAFSTFSVSQLYVLCSSRLSSPTYTPSIPQIIDATTFCVHGGLSPDIRTLDQIRVLSRSQEIPHEGAFCDLMWSDPDDSISAWAVSPRGAGWLFGGAVTKEFNHVNGLGVIARAHQLVQEGWKEVFEGGLVTVWSAPNYCYRCVFSTLTRVRGCADDH